MRVLFKKSVSKDIYHSKTLSKGKCKSHSWEHKPEWIKKAIKNIRGTGVCSQHKCSITFRKLLFPLSPHFLQEQMARYIYVIALDYISRTNNNLANLLLGISCSFIFEPVEKDWHTKALALNLLWFELEWIKMLLTGHFHSFVMAGNEIGMEKKCKVF